MHALVAGVALAVQVGDTTLLQRVPAGAAEGFEGCVCVYPGRGASIGQLSRPGQGRALYTQLPGPGRAEPCAQVCVGEKDGVWSSPEGRTASHRIPLPEHGRRAAAAAMAGGGPAGWSWSASIAASSRRTRLDSAELSTSTKTGAGAGVGASTCTPGDGVSVL